MKTDELHARAIRCLKEHSDLQRRIQPEIKRIAELDAELMRIHAELKLVGGYHDKNGDSLAVAKTVSES